MQSVIGVRGTLVFLLIYVALGFPEIRTCLENGGGAASCVVMGTFVGGFKAALYLMLALVRGLFALAG